MKLLNFFNVLIILLLTSIFIVYLILNRNLCETYEQPRKDSLSNVSAYIVTMKCRKDKAMKVAKELEGLKIRCNIVDAVEGKNLNIKMLFDSGMVSRDAGGLNDSDDILKREVGCTLSHKKALQQISQIVSCDYSIVLEDDAFLEDTFSSVLPKILEDIKLLKLDFDIMFLGNGWVDVNNKVSDNIYKINSYNIGEYWGSYGYMVCNKSAPKLVTLLEFIDQPTDVLLFRGANTDTKVYKTIEEIVGHSDATSTIR